MSDENVSSELAEANPVNTSQAAALLSKLTANDRDRASDGKFKNAVANSKDRIVATVTSEGNRTAITYDLDD